jgi:hypothetical protein
VPQEEIIDSCTEKTAGIMQPSVDKTVKLSLESDLAVKRKILPRNCGIHPENRAGSGVDPFKVQNLMLEISKQGYPEVENPMGFGKALEVDPPDEQQKFNEQNFAEAAGYLPVTCSHTRRLLALCNEEGNIDKSKMQGRKEKESELPACPDLPAYDYMHVVFAGMSLKRRCNSWP